MKKIGKRASKIFLSILHCSKSSKYNIIFLQLPMPSLKQENSYKIDDKPIYMKLLHILQAQIRILRRKIKIYYVNYPIIKFIIRALVILQINTLNNKNSDPIVMMKIFLMVKRNLQLAIVIVIRLVMMVLQRVNSSKNQISKRNYKH